MATARFVLDRNFTFNVRHTRGSINRLGGVIRRRTDLIARTVRRTAAAEAESAALRQQEAKTAHASAGFGESTRESYQQTKATAWAMRAYSESIMAVMRGVRDGERETLGRVLVNYPGATAIEFGGADPVVVLGNSTEHLQHAPQGLLRRAVAEVRA